MDLANIERQRLALAAQVEKLKDSLKHWQTWDLEYEGLKEELQALPTDSLDEVQLADLSTSYDGTLVNTKEIRDLTGLTTSLVRQRPQIINLIDRRIEYVTKNIETISRQFYVAENKLEEFAFAFSAASGANPRFDDEPDSESGKLPLMEIHEELDDDDNVISSELRRPEEETRKIIERLSRSSQQNATMSSEQRHTEDHGGTDTEAVSDADQSADESKRRPPIRKKSVSFSADTKPAPEPVRSESQEGRKSVSFASKVAIAPAASPPDTRSVSFATQIEEIPAQSDTNVAPVAGMSESESDKQKDLRASFKPGERVYELNEDDETLAQHVVLPENESPEDAQLRREMLEYHLNEVGSVVAQMDLDELDDHSDFTGSEYLDEETPYTSSGDDDEDEHGRSTRRQISQDYHEQMRALSAKLIGNIGPQPSDEELVHTELNPQDVHRLVIRGNRASSSSAASLGSDAEKKGKKRVSFAEAVDIAEDEPTPAKVPKVEATADMTDVVEHDSVEPGNIVADQLVERDTSQSTAAVPMQDDADPLLARRELATEYYRHRNDIIKQQGGFKTDHEDDDDDVGQLMEERDGKLKKVSRFKAARLKG